VFLERRTIGCTFSIWEYGARFLVNFEALCPPVLPDEQYKLALKDRKIIDFWNKLIKSPAR
jgi:hypothetical protein